MKKNCISSSSMFGLCRSLLLDLLREMDLLDFRVFTEGLITILGSDIVMKSGSKGNISLTIHGTRRFISNGLLQVQRLSIIGYLVPST